MEKIVKDGAYPLYLITIKKINLRKSPDDGVYGILSHYFGTDRFIPDQWNFPISIALIVVIFIHLNMEEKDKPENMRPDLAIAKSIEINSSSLKVWEVLTDPEMIKQYFTGAETRTNWLVGSEIIFIHVYEGQYFKNKGVILDFDPHRLLSYTYWTAFSNTEDKPENYTTITYSLEELNGKIKLTLTQTNFKSIEWYQGLEVGWNTVLAKIKEIAEA